MLNPTNFLPKKKCSHPKSVRRLKEQALRKGGLLQRRIAPQQIPGCIQLSVSVSVSVLSLLSSLTHLSLNVLSWAQDLQAH